MIKWSDIKLLRKGTKVEVEGIIRGLQLYNGFFIKGYSCFLVSGEDIIPMYGYYDSSTKAGLKISMLRYSAETNTPIRIRGITKTTDYTFDETNTSTIPTCVLQVKAVKLGDYVSLLWGLYND